MKQPGHIGVLLLVAMLAGVWGCDKSPAPPPPPPPPEVSPPAQPSSEVPSDAAAPTHAPMPQVRTSEWLAPKNRQSFFTDFDLTDQEGRHLKLADLMDKPLAISFIFTRCSNPKMCPAITLALANLQRDLAKQGLTDKVRLALLTYDPAYDTPERLKKYAQDRGVRFDNAVMLRPDPEQMMQLFAQLGVGVGFDSRGNVRHFIELLLIDHRGRFVRDYQGAVWDNRDVAADLQRLVEEHESTTDGQVSP